MNAAANQATQRLDAMIAKLDRDIADGLASTRLGARARVEYVADLRDRKARLERERRALGANVAEVARR